MSTLLARVAPLKPEIRLAQAIAQFEVDLSDEQRADFHSIKRQSCHSPPDIHDVMRLTAEIDHGIAGKVGGGRCFGTRLVSVLEAVQRFAALGDIVVGGSQNMIACGVWSLMLVNVSSWFDKLSELFMTVGRSAPRYQAMALLYPRSKKLQSYLSEYFLVVVRICHDLLKLTQKSMFAQLVSFMTESDMRSYQSDFDLWANAIKEEVNLLTTQQLQEQSRRLKTLSKYSKSESHRKKLENRLRILDSCSTYDYQTTWKEIRSVKQFLLSGSEGVAGQTFTIQDANKTMAGVVITYLDYGVFDTQLSNRVIPQIRQGAVPTKVVSSVLDSSSIQKLALRLLKSQEPSSIDVSKVLAKEGQYSKMQPASQFYFLLYARLYWAQHILRDPAPDPAQDPAIYRSLGRILGRNILVVDATDGYGRTPLQWAALRGHEAVARLLLEAGADKEAKDDDDRTPLHWAAENRHEAVARLLLEKGANKEPKNNNGQTPLHLAAVCGHEAITQLLLEAGADKEAKDDSNQTPLHWAAKGGHEAIARLLVEAGADKEAKDSSNQTPLHWAAERGHEGIARLFK
ncbi:hypothetical protein ACJ41O_005844 [Fusarium nematophilum]